MKRWIPLLAPFLCACACAAYAPCALASTAGADSSGSERPADAILRFVSAELARSQPGLRAEITVGEIDPHLRLVPCERTEAFLRPGGHLWGRSFVGFRCLQRSGWSISVPVTIRLFGPSLVAVQPLAALQPISASAVRPEEIEVSREPGGVVTQMDQVEDRICTRSIEPGSPIPLSCLRTMPAVAQGEPVKLVGIGSGFSISTDGTALSTAAAGELVRVRTESGRTVSGFARKGRVVEVRF